MRLVTFEMCIKVLRLFIFDGDVKRLKDKHLAMVEVSNIGIPTN